MRGFIEHLYALLWTENWLVNSKTCLNPWDTLWTLCRGMPHGSPEVLYDGFHITILHDVISHAVLHETNVRKTFSVTRLELIFKLICRWRGGVMVTALQWGCLTSDAGLRACQGHCTVISSTRFYHRRAGVYFDKLSRTVVLHSTTLCLHSFYWWLKRKRIR